MNFKQTFAGVTLALAVSGTTVAQASQFIENFRLNSNGTGFDGAITVESAIDLSGLTYVHSSFSDSDNFTFQQAARFSAFSADGGLTEIDPALRATFIATGTGNITTQALTFNTGGILRLNRNDSVQFGTFELIEASANLAANTTIPQGTVSAIFKAVDLKPGYLFLNNGTDLSSVSNANLLFGFSTTNALPAADGTQVNGPLITLYNSTFDPDVTAPIFTNGITDVQFSTNGQFRLATVPVPAAFWLLGSGLAGLITLGKRKKLAA